MAQKITHFSVGDLWQPQFTFTSGGSNVDPTTLTVLQQDPAGTETTVASSASVAAMTTVSTPVAKMSTGVFKLNPGISLSSAGYWFVKGIGQGAAQATIQEQVVVDPDEFTSNAGVSTRALVKLPEVKDWLQQQNLTVSEDLELVRVINDVSDRIYYESGGREFIAKDSGTTRTFDVSNYGYCIYVGDLASLTTASPAITVSNHEGTAIKTLNPSDVTLYPLNREPWEPIRKLEFSRLTSPLLSPGYRVAVTGTWGFPSVPGNIRQAALDAIAAIMDRDVEHYRQDLGSLQGEGGNVVVLQSPQQMYISLPPGAFAVARSYKDPLLG